MTRNPFVACRLSPKLLGFWHVDLGIMSLLMLKLALEERNSGNFPAFPFPRVTEKAPRVFPADSLMYLSTWRLQFFVV